MGLMAGAIDTAITLAVMVLITAQCVHLVYRGARLYGWFFWAILGMALLACVLIVPLALLLGTDGFGQAHPLLAMAAMLAAVTVMVTMIAIAGVKLQRRYGGSRQRVSNR